MARSLDKKEHPGRVRGFSGGITIKDVFGKSHRTSQRFIGFSNHDVAELTARVRKETLESLGPLIRQETVGILKRIGVQVPEDLDELQSSCQSVEPIKSVSMSKERNKNPDIGDIKVTKQVIYK